MNKSALIRKKTASIAFKVCRGLLLFGLCFLILGPVLQKLSVSFMSVVTGTSDFSDPAVVNIPSQFSFDNYVLTNTLMNYFPTLGRTFVVNFAAAFFQICTCLLAGYGFARFKFPLKNLWFMCVILLIIVPPQLLYAPLYLNFTFFDIFGLFRLIMGRSLNLLNTIQGYILLHAGGMGIKSGLYIFMLRQYFRTVPREIEEAAYADGCGRLMTLFRIILPDALPMVTSCFLFSFVWQWTDSIFTQLFLNDNTAVLATVLNRLELLYFYGKPLNQEIVSQTYTKAIDATGILMVTAPLVVIYLAAQKTFVRSLSQTGLKM
jgi:multiple sugar transport system permease protein